MERLCDICDLSRARVFAACAGIVCVLTAGLLAQAAGDRQVFRGGVDVLTVDVQVVDAGGRPISGLTPDAFTATVGGRTRKVISAELIIVYRSTAQASTSATAASTVASPPPGTPGDGPAYFLTIDCLSFEPTQTLAVVRAAKNFVTRLGPDERVGLFAYPIGPKMEATTDHAAVLAELDKISGQNTPPAGFIRENRPSPHAIVDATDPHLTSHNEPPGPIQRVALEEESQNIASLGMLSAFMRALRPMPGRKIVVLVSSGLISADRPGYRPDLGEHGIRVGQEAAASNATIYALFVDQTYLGYGAGRQRLETGESIQRDSAILNRYLDQVSGASGGTMLTALTDDGVAAFGRILEETSSFYQLGIEAETGDRDGKPHALVVRISARGAKVRAPSWVMIPAAQ